MSKRKITGSKKNLPAAGLVLLAVLLLASCTREEILPGVPPGHSLYVASAIIAPAPRTETEVNTRVTGDDVPVTVTTGSLGIFRSKSTGYTEALNNKKYTYDPTNGWQPATAADTLFLNGNDADVCAYYPYNSDAYFSSPKQILLASGKYFGSGAANPAGDYKGTDICYAINRTVNAARRATTFEMKHALALLEFRISKEAGYTDECRITSIAVMNPAMLSETTIDITTGTYGTTPTKGTITYNPGADADGILIEGAAVTTGALLVPFTPTSEGLTIAFAVNGTPVEAVISATDIAKLEAGHRYSVKVTMKANSMQVTGVDMIPWEEVGVGGDDYTWYPVQDLIKLTKPIHIASYDWAWSNLDYVNGAITLRDYQTWPNDYAVHWPYCVMTPNTVPGGDPIPGSSVYNYATDPCSALNATLGGTWTLPTKHQINLLLATDHVAGEKGHWFGTSAVPAKDDGTYLFMPANSELLLTNSSPTFNVGAYWMADGTDTEFFMIDPSSTPPIGITNINYGLTPYNALVRCVEKERESIPLGDVEWAMGNLVKKPNGTYVIDEHQAVIPTITGAPDTAMGWGEVAEGYHFTWNSLERKVVADNAAWEYDIANDPCTKVAPAGTWRTPTKADFESAIAQGVCTNATYTIGGVDVPGIYLGTTSQPAKGESDKYLFLPKAGGGDQATFYDRETSYWSSTEVDPAGASQKSAYKFSAGSISSSFSKTHPAAIRCVKGKAKPAHTIDIGLDFYVADGNLVATANGSGGYTYAFADEQGAYTGDITGKDYFAWNTLEPGVTDPNKTSDWNDTQDPCHKIGDVWCTPTKTQLDALISTGSAWGTWKKADGTTVNGRYFGTTNAPNDESKQNEFVFLPAAGYEYTTGIDFVGTRGAYRSSTNEVGGGIMESDALWFSETNVPIISYEPQDGSSGGYAQTNLRYPIRCVRAR